MPGRTGLQRNKGPDSFGEFDALCVADGSSQIDSLGSVPPAFLRDVGI